MTKKTEMEVIFRKAKSQASYKMDKWTLTLPEWFALWDDKWDKRGRGADQYCMWRKDREAGWHKDNIEIIPGADAASRRGYRGNHKAAGLKHRKYKDPIEHEMFLAYIQQRNQANFRKEGWAFPEADWMDMWRENWNNKGRHSDEYCMGRLDQTKPWTKENCFVDKRKSVMSYVGRLGSRCDIQTPRGIFKTQREAAKAMGVSEYQIIKLRKEEPTQYYYTNKKK